MSKRSFSNEDVSAPLLKRNQLFPLHKDAPILNSVPKTILPIVQPPFKVGDFFNDLSTNYNDKDFETKIQNIVKLFPPPPLPTYITQKYSNGVMVPFIYPPPPKMSSNIDKNDINDKLGNNESGESDKNKSKNRNKNKNNDNNSNKSLNANNNNNNNNNNDDDDDNNSNSNNNDIKNNNNEKGENGGQYLSFPPLPFPPPNYMPYPLVSDNASLTPNEVFTAFLDALKVLPRIDMVLASAAGSLTDMRVQADQEGFTISEFEENHKLIKDEVDDDGDEIDDEDEELVNSGDSSEMKKSTTSDGTEVNLGHSGSGPILSADAELIANAAAAAAVAAARKPRRRGRPSKNAYKEEMEALAAEKSKLIREMEANNGIIRSARETPVVDTRTPEQIEYDKYLSYAQGIDMTYEEDIHHVSNSSNTYVLRKDLPKGYDQVAARTSNLPRSGKLKLNSNSNSMESVRFKTDEYSMDEKELDDIESESTYDTNAVLSSRNGQKEILSANGLNKERRIEDLNRSVVELDEYESANRIGLYHHLKLQKLQRLQDLKDTKVNFETTDEEIKDQQLLEAKLKFEELRDDELVRLKLFTDYQFLNNALTFYRESNKVYKSMNTLMLNKLKKLQNFFEFQKQVFTKALENEDEASIFDIKTKDATRLYAGISNKDIGAFLKETLKSGQLGRTPSPFAENEAAPLLSAPGSKEVTPVPEINGTANLNVDAPIPVLTTTEGIHSPSVPATRNQLLSEKDIFRLAQGKLAPPSSLVHDFIPLVSEEEFNMITGDLPKYKNGGVGGSEPGSSTQKGVSSQNLKHQIFMSPLYDPLTSGSDTNSEASSAATPKRRGRRAVNPPSGPGDKLIDTNDKINQKLSEAWLLAKIMKHYIPPMGAKPEELNDDLEQLGIRTKWPVNK